MRSRLRRPDSDRTFLPLVAGHRSSLRAFVTHNLARGRTLPYFAQDCVHYGTPALNRFLLPPRAEKRWTTAQPLPTRARDPAHLTNQGERTP